MSQVVSVEVTTDMVVAINPPPSTALFDVILQLVKTTAELTFAISPPPDTVAVFDTKPHSVAVTALSFAV
eukprot:3398920-Rhodomonas_salina.1